MKIIIILISVVFISGCATSNYNPMYGECKRDALNELLKNESDDIHYMNCLEQKKRITAQKEYETKLTNDPEFAKSEQLRIAKEKKDAEEYVNAKSKSTEFNTPLTTFKKYWGEPQTEELINGDKVLWYDGSSPFFAVFKNNKLVSIFIDRQTIQQRESNQLIERQHQESIEQSERIRKQAVLLNWSNNMEANRRQSQQEFQQRMMIQQLNKPVTTNCRNNGYGTVTCTSN